MAEKQKKHKNVFTEWLETLQQESWQLELLISGLALFGIWEARGLVNRLNMRLSGADVFHDILGNLIGFGVFALKAGLLIILVNFLIHVSLRALWIGAIGLRYVSGDIDYSRLKYSSRFEQFYARKIGSFDDYIERLENWCSVIFAYTFLVVGVFFSFMLYLAWFALATSLIAMAGQNNAVFMTTTIFSLAYFGIGVIIALDFITLGLFRTIEEKTFSLIYLRIYQFFGIITLSFVYRPLLLNFLDQKFTRRLFFLSIPYVAILLVLVPKFEVVALGHVPPQVNEFGLVVSNYDDLRNEAFEQSMEEDPRRMEITYFSLEKHIIDESYAKIFFKIRPSDSDYFDKLKGVPGYRKTGLRHELLASGELKDEVLEKRLEEADSLISITRDARFKWSRSSDKPDSLRTLQAFRNRVDSLNDVKSKIRRERFVERTSAMLDGYLDLIRINIDSIDYTDSISCKFFTHPNLQEKGLLCVYPTRALEDGEHLIYIERDVYSKNEPDSIRTRKWWVPVWKYEDYGD